jgi:hypothetical protein
VIGGLLDQGTLYKLYSVLTITLFIKKMITKTAEVANLVRYSIKYAEDNTQENINTAAVIIKIAAEVDNGATIAEAVIRHVASEDQLAAIDELYKVAISNLPAVIPPNRPQPQRLLGYEQPASSQAFKDAWREKMRAEEARYKKYDNGDGTFSDIFGRRADSNGRWSYTHHGDGSFTDQFGRTTYADGRTAESGRPFERPNEHSARQASGRSAGQSAKQRFGQGFSNAGKAIKRHPYATAGLAAASLAAAGYGAYKAFNRPTNTTQQPPQN